MGWGRFLERYTGDLDTFCAYRTARTLLIRDRRLGLLHFSLQSIIFLYVVVYQIAFSQVYLAQSDFNGVVRLQLKAPSTNMRWPNGYPPYCLGTSSVSAAYPLAPGYAILPGAAFTKDGQQFAQRHCQFLDETTAVPIPETDRMFLTTETRATAQSTSAGCANFESLNCTFSPPYDRNNDNVTRRSFVADIEFFTLLVDHNINAPLAGIHRTGAEMRGKLVGADGRTALNVCDEYAGFPSGCPVRATAGFDIAVGQPGLNDIVAIGTLLRAAGIGSLDSPAGLSGIDASESYREAGLVLNLVRPARCDARCDARSTPSHCAPSVPDNSHTHTPLPRP